jgi:hypothetical protein
VALFIDRVEGPMLGNLAITPGVGTLERQGVDLDFTSTGTTILHLDTINSRVGVNTATARQALDVNGNTIISNVLIDLNSNISTTTTNQQLTIKANGVANVQVINANVWYGNIDAVQIGTIIPTRAFFTTANTSGLASFNTANVRNLTTGRVTFSLDGILQDDANLSFSTANGTLTAYALQSITSVTYPGLTTANLVIAPNPVNGQGGTFGNGVPYMASNLQVVTTPGLQYFVSNGVFLTGNIRVSQTVQNRVLWSDASRNVQTGHNLTYDGFTFVSNNTNILNSLQMTGARIQALGSNQDLQLYPSGTGAIDAGSHYIYNVTTKVSPTGQDPNFVATKGYVDTAISGATIVNSSIGQKPFNHAGTFVVASDDGSTMPNVVISVHGANSAVFTEGFANIGLLSLHDNDISSTVGRLSLTPNANERLVIVSNSSVRIPSGTTTQRPGFHEAGDFRHNSDTNSLEYSDGSGWNNLVPAAHSQIITPDGVSTAFTMQYAAANETILVILNGVVQQPALAYSVSGYVLTFVEVPLATDQIEIRFLALNITYASTPLFVNAPFKQFNTSYFTFDSWYKSQYRGAQYSYIFKNPSQTPGQYAMGEIYLMHDGSDAYINVREYSNTQNPFLSFNAYIDAYGVVFLQVKGTNSGNFIKYRVTYFGDNL